MTSGLIYFNVEFYAGIIKDWIVRMLLFEIIDKILRCVNNTDGV